jgi:hypothetical protein
VPKRQSSSFLCCNCGFYFDYFRPYAYLLVAIERPSQGGVAGGVVCGISGMGGFVSARSARLKAGWWAKGLMLYGRQRKILLFSNGYFRV